MKTETINISKQAVYEEVAKTTAYLGAKRISDEQDTYSAFSTTDEDRLMLEEYWVEACNAATQTMKRYVVEVSEQTIGDGTEDDTYTATLQLPDTWPSTLHNAVKSELFAFFAALITAKWLDLAGSDKSDTYGKLADAKQSKLSMMLYHRDKPQYSKHK